MRCGFGFIAGVLAGGLCGAVAVSGIGGSAAARQQESATPIPPDYAELARLCEQDQADRSPVGGGPIDWAVVAPNDRRREARVKALYESGKLHTGPDYRRAAMVLQHAERPEQILLGHEFCLVALAKGDQEARWLAAASEDRFLMYTNQPQRFGTQYRSSRPDEPMRLYEVGSWVTDTLRKDLGVPTLAEARGRVAEMNEKLNGKGPSPRP